MSGLSYLLASFTLLFFGVLLGMQTDRFNDKFEGNSNSILLSWKKVLVVFGFLAAIYLIGWGVLLFIQATVEFMKAGVQ